MDIQHGLCEFRKSSLAAIVSELAAKHGLLADPEKKCRRGPFDGLYWTFPTSASDREMASLPWEKEIQFAIKQWGLDLLDYEFQAGGAIPPSLSDRAHGTTSHSLYD